MIELRIGDVVGGKYAVRRRIAEGGMGVVWEAEQSLGTAVRRVAIKTLHANLSADAHLRARFEREVATVCRLEHPNVIHVYDYGTAPEGYLYIVMEYVQGTSISHELNKTRVMSLPRTSHVLDQVAGALAEAHGLGIVHRDLKPDNLMLTERAGIKDFVKVLDFGIAKSGRDSLAGLTRAGAMLGTPPYMSPEQFQGIDVGPQSDVYSLGMVLYEMLSGALPFEADNPWAWARHHMETTPRDLSLSPDTGSLPRGVTDVVMRCLKKDPRLRPAGMASLRREFLGAASVAPVSHNFARTEAVPVVVNPYVHTAATPAPVGAYSPRERTSVTPPPPAATRAATGPSAWESPVIPAAVPTGPTSRKGLSPLGLAGAGGATLLLAGAFVMWGMSANKPAPTLSAPRMAEPLSAVPSSASGAAISPNAEPVEFNRPVAPTPRAHGAQPVRSGGPSQGSAPGGGGAPSGAPGASGSAIEMPAVAWSPAVDLGKIFGPGTPSPVLQPTPQPAQPAPTPVHPAPPPSLPPQPTIPAQPSLSTPAPASLGAMPQACVKWQNTDCRNTPLGGSPTCDDLRRRCPPEYR